MTQKTEGVKHDGAKIKWSLLPFEELSQVVEVLDMGANKYGEGNWKYVYPARDRYFNAAMRHILAWWSGEKVDEESGRSHLAHAVSCLLFLMWHENLGK